MIETDLVIPRQIVAIPTYVFSEEFSKRQPAEGVHPNTFDFLVRVFGSGGLDLPISDFQRALIAKYFTTSFILSSAGDELAQMNNAIMIHNAFSNLRGVLSSEGQEEFPEITTPFLKQQDLGILPTSGRYVYNLAFDPDVDVPLIDTSSEALRVLLLNSQIDFEEKFKRLNDARFPTHK